MGTKKVAIDIGDHFDIENVISCQKSTTIIDRVHRWAQSRSLWAYYFGNSCCNENYIQATEGNNPLADSHKIMRAYSPMQADLLILSGPISSKLFPEVLRVYESMPNPKWVMAIGACASSGGLFESYNICNHIEKEIKIDVYVPGCPPSSEAIVEGFDLVRQKIKRCGFEGQQ